MNEKDLRPASTFAQQFGVKSVGFGPPGQGKTPLINTAPRPLLLVLEPGMLSMRNSNVPAFKATTISEIDEFFKWFFGSNEVKKYDTLGIDSISQMAEIGLVHYKKRNPHGLKAYGEMAEWAFGHLENLYYMQQKHLYLIAKQGLYDVGGGVIEKKPFFPGKDLGVRVPHLYDLVMHVEKTIVPNSGDPNPQLALRCQSDPYIGSRDRSGRLDMFEPPNLANVFAKAMS